MTEPLVSIIMRSFNEGWALRKTLASLRAQDYKRWELIVVDSGSTDGSVGLIRRMSPARFVQIAPSEYNPARVMNHAMTLMTSQLAIFLNADATPQGSDWLRPLVSALGDSNVAAVFGRQIPRPDCQAVFAHDYERCFGPNRQSAQWDHFFSMASSGVRREVWLRRGFNERLRYSEDDEFTRWCVAQGYRIAYVPESVAMHSHNYTPSQVWKRSFGEGESLAAVMSGSSPSQSWTRSVAAGWARDACRDFAYCWRNGRLREWPHAARTRWTQRRARFAGFAKGWSRFRSGHEAGKALPPLWAFPAP
jgi:rhamnosyltransferase